MTNGEHLGPEFLSFARQASVAYDDKTEIGSELTVCIAEDRVSCEPALRVLVASLAAHCPDLKAYLFCPNASLDFKEWIACFSNAILNARALDGDWNKYDIKPQALLTMLESGFSNVVWIDSDILIAGDFRPLLGKLSPDTIAVTEEALCSGHADSHGLRAKLWGMEVGRVLPFTANTGVVRVTSEHLQLLRHWRALLEGPEYRAAQQRPWNERGLHVMGDQEVFTALLSSREYANFPIRFLRRGDDIIQFFGSSGYTTHERIRHLRTGMPPFVHSQGFRPWWPRIESNGPLSNRLQNLYNDLSPYTVLAARYAGELSDPGWLSPKSTISRWLVKIGGGNAAMTGLPLALGADIIRWLKGFRAQQT